MAMATSSTRVYTAFVIGISPMAVPRRVVAALPRLFTVTVHSILDI